MEEITLTPANKWLEDHPNEYPTGTLAYIDTFAGLVKCKILEILPQKLVRVKITATKGAYMAGEIQTRGFSWVVPRKQVRIRSGIFRIMNNYTYTDGLVI